ncbi:MAG: lysine--tRNA ligase [Firmicutes bacterium]|nr:lysine--tRNA ligase [Bacillota bacterium]
MHWADEVAAELIRLHPNKEIFICASGITPSGTIHIGNFREAVTSYFVARALRDAGKKVRLIYSWDTYDRLRKVPANVDPSYSKYIGMPINDIPDPAGTGISYAQSFINPFEEAMTEFGMEVECINQAEMYKSGVYKDGIIKALKARKEIYDILMSFKTQEASAADRESYYPINIYCRKCGKDTTKVKALSNDCKSLTYTCACGHEESLDLNKDFNVKLPWKVDWPMRWVHEGVDFEPGGRDHSSEGGSYQVASVIVDKIFGGRPPHYRGYEFINIKGMNTKMSSSSGNAIAPEELLKIYNPEIILWMFTRFLPEKAFDIAVDEEVLRTYHEFDRMCKAVTDGTADDVVKRSISLAAGDKKPAEQISASNIAAFAPIVNFDLDLLVALFNKIGEKTTRAEIEARFNKIKYWLQKYCPEQIVALLADKNKEFFTGMSAEEKGWIKKLSDSLRAKDMTTEELQSLLYDIPKIDGVPDKAKQKRFFEVVYNLLIGKSTGPRLYLFLAAIDKNKLIELLGNS